MTTDVETPVWETTVDRGTADEASGLTAEAAGFTGPAEVDVVVVGAGLTGLSTALHLARLQPDRSILVLEAGRVGAGASGRNTGIVGPGVGGPMRGLRKRFGGDRAAAMFRYSQDAVRTVIRLIDEERIGCDVTPSRHLLCGYTQAQAARLAREAACFAELGLDVPFLDRAALADRLGHGTYFGALVYEPVVLVNPLKLTLGLADAARRAGVRVAEGSPVTALTQRGSGVRVQVGADGQVDAQTVVLATDGYTPPDFPHGKRIVSVRTHVMATRPLTAAERAGLGWAGTDAVIDQRTFFSYYRLDADGRLLFGGGPVLRPDAGPAASERIYRRLERGLATLFPSLREVAIQRRWSGLTGATIDRIPVVGPVPRRPGVIFAGAWSGHGLAMSVGGGASLAERLAGAGPAASYPWLRSSTRNPRLGPLQPAFVSSYVAAYDGADRLGAAVQRLRRTPHPVPTHAPAN